MKLRTDELEFLSAWAREEKAPDPYVLPAHQMQAAHQIPGVALIRAIKAWARLEGKRDEDIFSLFNSTNPPWPWPSTLESCLRLEEVASAHQGARKVG
jgi:predicted ATPase